MGSSELKFIAIGSWTLTVFGSFYLQRFDHMHSGSYSSSCMPENYWSACACAGHVVETLQINF